MKFCCDVLRDTFWWYSNAKPIISYCPYCGSKVDVEQLKINDYQFKQYNTQKENKEK